MGEWNEADHPRAEDGEFEGAGGYGPPDMGLTATVAEMANDPSRAVDAYVGDGYIKINGDLREAGGDVGRISDPEVLAAVSGMDEAIRDSPSMAQRSIDTVYRGIDGDLVPQVANLHPGDTLQDHGYMSTTRSLDIAPEFGPAAIEIHCPPDLQAAIGKAHEQELILGRGTVLTYVGQHTHPLSATYPIYEFEVKP